MTTRRLLPLAALLTALTIGPSPASAAPAAVVFTGTWQEDCWGCGPTHGSADLTFVGTHSGPAHAEFTADAPGGALCPVSGAATGHISGPLEIDLNWTRLGAWAILTTSGAVTGTGTAVWVPNAISCGYAMSATVAGTFGGV